MRKLYLLLALLILPLAIHAQSVVEDTYEQLHIHYTTPRVNLDNTTLLDTKYQVLTIDGYMPGGRIGQPTIPVLTSLIEIPLCNKIEVVVSDATYDTIDFDPSLPYLPAQPGRCKSDTTPLQLHIDRGSMTENHYHGGNLATVSPLGISRDRRLANITYSPVKVNPVAHKAIVCREADIIIKYIDVDKEGSEQLYTTYHTPAFSTGKTLNSLYTPAKGSKNIQPLKMLIVSHSSLRCQRLEHFANWKRRQGINVDIFYYDDHGLSGAANIASYLRGLYAAATENNPAATYLLLIGDHEQLPMFKSKATASSYYGLNNDHYTDLYYATWTNDDRLPDCFYGRISATDTISLGRILNKTILYESYSFHNDNYLSHAVLIAGIDQVGYYPNYNDYAYTFADPTMDYIAKYYIHPSNGYNNTHYFKNRTDFAPSGVHVSGSSRSDTTNAHLKQLYNNGMGWINYSGHGQWNCWEIPQFNTSNAAQMNNQDMPSFMIGNCCLSNKIDKTECLGEALLRRDNNAGAVAYIGATSYTFWGEDFYWCVGVRNNISGTMNATYNVSHMGMYDRLFHTHNETVDMQATTAGSMVLAGNLSVQSTSGSEWGSLVAPYYWEIYELLGDPSLTPWLGKADSLPFRADTTTSPIRITTVPNAYISLVDTATLNVISAAYANLEGYAYLEVPEGASLSASFLSASAQGYIPYIEGLDNVKLGLIVSVKVSPNPSADHVVLVEGTGLKSIAVFNTAGHLMGQYKPTADLYYLDLRHLLPGPYILLIDTSDGPATKTIIIGQ